MYLVSSLPPLILSHAFLCVHVRGNNNKKRTNRSITVTNNHKI